MKFAWIVLVLGALASCGTIEGIGQDISGGSRKVKSWF